MRKRRLRKSIERTWQKRAGVILAIFLITTTSGCASLPDSLNLAAPIRPVEPKLNFKDTGQHCLVDKELDELSTYILGVRKYEDTTEAIINSVNNP